MAKLSPLPSLFSFLFLLSGYAHAATAVEMGNTWSQRQSGSVSRSEWDQLTQIMSEDHEVHALLDDVREKMGMTSISDLHRILEIKSDLPTGVQGQYEHLEKRFSTASVQNPDADPKQTQPEAQLAIKDSVASRSIKGPTMNELVVEMTPSICVRNGLDQFNAITTLVHELQHLRGDEFTVSEDPLQYRDEEDYIQRSIEASGGELESFTTQVRAAIRLSQRTGKRIVKEYEMLRYFDSQGNLIDRKGLIRYILEDLGYRERQSKEYGRLLTHSYQSTQSRLSFHQNQLLSHAKQRLATHEKNAQVYRSNLDSLLKYQPGSTLLTETQRKLSQTEAEIQKSQVAIRNIESESRVLQTRLSALRDRMNSLE